MCSCSVCYFTVRPGYSTRKERRIPEININIKPELQCFFESTKEVLHNKWFGLVYWGLTPQQPPGSYQGGEMMMMKSVIWWRKPEYPEETTDLRQVTDEAFHTYGLCPVRGLNWGRSGVKQSELRREESGALAHRATVLSSNKNNLLKPCRSWFL